MRPTPLHDSGKLHSVNRARSLNICKQKSCFLGRLRNNINRALGSVRAFDFKPTSYEHFFRYHTDAGVVFDDQNALAHDEALRLRHLAFFTYPPERSKSGGVPVVSNKLLIIGGSRLDLIVTRPRFGSHISD